MSAQRLHVLARRVELRRRGVGGVGRVRGETRGARASVGGVAARRLDGVAQRRNLADVILDRTPKLRVETRDVFGVKARVVAHCERVRGVATSGLGGVFGDAEAFGGVVEGRAKRVDRRRDDVGLALGASRVGIRGGCGGGVRGVLGVRGVRGVRERVGGDARGGGGDARGVRLVADRGSGSGPGEGFGVVV